MFWLHMNKGLWFSSPQKIMLTLLNIFAICVGIALVSVFHGSLWTAHQLTWLSVFWVFMLQVQPFIIILTALVSHANHKSYCEVFEILSKPHEIFHPRSSLQLNLDSTLVHILPSTLSTLTF